MALWSPPPPPPTPPATCFPPVLPPHPSVPAPPSPPPPPDFYPTHPSHPPSLVLLPHLPPHSCSLDPPHVRSSPLPRPAAHSFVPPFSPPLPPSPPHGVWLCSHGRPPFPHDDGPPGRGVLHVPAGAGGVCVVVRLGPPATRAGLRWLRGFWR